MRFFVHDPLEAVVSPSVSAMKLTDRHTRLKKHLQTPLINNLLTAIWGFGILLVVPTTHLSIFKFVYFPWSFRECSRQANIAWDLAWLLYADTRKCVLYMRDSLSLWQMFFFTLYFVCLTDTFFPEKISV